MGRILNNVINRFHPFFFGKVGAGVTRASSVGLFVL